jgi:hypothetical protein
MLTLRVVRQICEDGPRPTAYLEHATGGFDPGAGVKIAAEISSPAGLAAVAIVPFFNGERHPVSEPSQYEGLSPEAHQNHTFFFRKHSTILCPRLYKWFEWLVKWDDKSCKVFDLALPLEQAAEGYRAMDERRAIKKLLHP